MCGDGVGLDEASTSSPGFDEESIMRMLDWNTYRQQLVAGVGGLGWVCSRGDGASWARRSRS
jgi:hypothetical protein